VGSGTRPVQTQLLKKMKENDCAQSIVKCVWFVNKFCVMLCIVNLVLLS
jgi:hypothetical protein